MKCTTVYPVLDRIMLIKFDDDPVPTRCALRKWVACAQDAVVAEDLHGFEVHHCEQHRKKEA